jgi:Ni,Fe-hydrogenase I cytochrome b subunit
MRGYDGHDHVSGIVVRRANIYRRKLFRRTKAMTRDAKLMSGVLLITLPTIQYGGYFLLTSLMNKNSGYMENPLRQNFFRAGHAHAGVIVILSLVCQVLADSAMLPDSVSWMVRVGVPLAAILIPLGFFLSMASPNANQPNGMIALIYAGAIVLAISVLTLGIGLLRGALAGTA